MTKLYLVRHCQYANPKGILPGRLPVELSEEGLREAVRLRLFFKDKHINKIYSSAVRRCQQTSEQISSGAIPIEYDQRLLETFSAYQGFWVEDWKDLAFVKKSFYLFIHRIKIVTYSDFAL